MQSYSAKTYYKTVFWFSATAIIRFKGLETVGLSANVPVNPYTYILELREQEEINMSDLWLGIYSLIMESDEDALQRQNHINIEMERMLIPYKNKLSDEESEKLHTLLYDMVDITQKQAMLFGIKFMLKLIFHL